MGHTVRLTGVLDPRSGWNAVHCSVAGALEVVGTRSAMLLLREAFYGTTRFEDFVQRAGISEPVTATRLREFVEQGLLEKRPYREPGRRTRDEYTLTAKGADLFPVLAALMQWGDRWTATDGGPIAFAHHDCGEPVTVEPHCTIHGPLTPSEIDVSARPGE